MEHPELSLERDLYEIREFIRVTVFGFRRERLNRGILPETLFTVHHPILGECSLERSGWRSCNGSYFPFFAQSPSGEIFGSPLAYELQILAAKEFKYFELRLIGFALKLYLSVLLLIFELQELKTTRARCRRACD